MSRNARKSWKCRSSCAREGGTEEIRERQLDYFLLRRLVEGERREKLLEAFDDIYKRNLNKDEKRGGFSQPCLNRRVCNRPLLSASDQHKERFD